MLNKLIILDLDETLIRSEQTLQISNFSHTQLSNLFVYKRPYTEEFLSFLKSHFAIAVWTSASRDYAESILDILKIDQNKLVFFYTREQCLIKNDDKQRRLYFSKDTTIIKQLTEKFDSVFFIDDSPDKIINTNINIIPIKAFILQENDSALIDLLNFFKNEK